VTRLDTLFDIVDRRNRNMAERYQSVNGAWPQAELPKMTGHEAIRAGKRLYRLAMGSAWKGKWKAGRGNHRTYPRGNTFLVNPGQGWHDMVHDLSHYCHRRLHPDHKPHDGRGTHAFIEKTMIEHVVNSGWLGGTLKRPGKSKPDLKAVRYRRIVSRIGRWDAKRKRAETALRKLRRQRAYYEKATSLTA
jgi:hypothetical protein